MRADLKKRVDDKMKSIYKDFRLDILDVTFSDRVAMVSRIAKNITASVRDFESVTTYIFNEYIPKPLHNKWS